MLLNRCLESTQSDFIEFSNFNVVDRKMRKLCGEGSNYTVVSDGSFFRLTFTSNDIFDGTGFRGRYEFRSYREGRLHPLFHAAYRYLFIARPKDRLRSSVGLRRLNSRNPNSQRAVPVSTFRIICEATAGIESQLLIVIGLDIQ